MRRSLLSKWADRRLVLAFALLLVGWTGAATSARGEDSLGDELAARVLEVAAKTPAMPTFGGLQYWNDVRVTGEWRIQRNVLTGHYRLLDDDDHRQAWGTFEECDEQLEKAVAEGDATPARGEVVVVLHGLGSGRWAMHSLTKHLRDQGFTVIEFGYSTTSGGVAEHAAALAKVLADQTGAEKIHFVAHSLGNLVVRHYLADHAESPDPRVGRMVMLAPPNQGAAAAKTWARSKAMTRTLGPVLKELGPDWKTLAPKLATPTEFAIIAGGMGNDYGFNVVLDGDDDGTVRVEETRLEGATESLVVPSLHSLIVYRDDVFAATTNFLRHGSFEAPDAEGKP
jgi:pimeloyl-ACP methyl ester carboxylesterase